MPDFIFEPVPNEVALEWLKRKKPLAASQFEQLLPELEAYAFTVSGLESLDALQDVLDTVASVPAGGDFAAARKRIAGVLMGHIPPAPSEPELFAEFTDVEKSEHEEAMHRRAGFILRTQVNKAYAYGAYQDIAASADVLPFWQYLTVGDEHVRDTHRALNNIILPANHEFWKSHFPPWEFGCRCQVVPISAEEAHEIRDREAALPEHERNFMEGTNLKRLEDERKLIRHIVANTPVDLDLRSPVEKGKENPWKFEPWLGLVPDADALKSQYDPAVWSVFEGWAKAAKVKAGQTVWSYLVQKKLKAKKTLAPIPPLSPIAHDFPADLASADVIRRLGGSTGAELVRIDGRDYVLKRGSSADHLREEFAAEQLYRAAGIGVPESKLYETAHGPAKLSVFHSGKTLAELLPTDRGATAVEKVRAGFATDALLANWDVAGLDMDNILVTPEGVPLRIDAGGALRFRAMGTRKATDAFGPEVPELITLRDAARNAQAARLFATLTDEDIRHQVSVLQKRRAAILAAAPADLRPTLGKRLDWMAEKYPHGAAIIPVADRPTSAPWFTPAFAESASKARVKGRTYLGDKDLVEDLSALVWEEKDATGAPVTRVKLRLTAAGSAAMQSALGTVAPDATTATAPGRRVHPKDSYWSALKVALGNVNHHASDGSYNAAKLANAIDLVPQLEAAAKSKDATEAAMATHYLGVIDAIKTAQTGKAKTAFFESYEPPLPVAPASSRPDSPARTLHATSSKLEWTAKRRDRGNAVAEGAGIHTIAGALAVTSPDHPAKAGFVPWSSTAAPYAFRGYVEITVPGAVSPETLGHAGRLMKDAGVDLTPASAEHVEAVYLMKHLALRSDVVAGAKAAQWKTIATDPQLPDVAKVEKLREIAKAELGIDHTAAHYNPAGQADAWGEGWQKWERADLPRGELEKKLKGWGLTHDLSSLTPLPQFVDSILHGGGVFTPTTERLRTGIDLSAGSSTSSGMASGGANYIFTRIAGPTKVKGHRGPVFKPGNLARLDAFSFDHDVYGDVRPSGQNTHGIDPHAARAKTLDEFKAHAKGSSNETIFKWGIPFLDEIQSLNVSTPRERDEVLNIFTSHKITHLPDGRAVADIIKLP